MTISEPDWTREDEESQIDRLKPIAEHLRVGHHADPDQRRHRDTWLHIALLAEEWFTEHPVSTVEEDTHPSRTRALIQLAQRGEEPRHADKFEIMGHGHGPMCCCLMQICRSSACTLNAQIIANIEVQT